MIGRPYTKIYYIHRHISYDLFHSFELLKTWNETITVWKLIFLIYFIPLLDPFNITKLNVLKQQNVISIDSFSDLCKWIVIKQLILVSGYTKIPYDLYCLSVWKDIKSKFAITIFPSLAAVKLHKKDNRWSMFFEINNDTKPAYKDETEDDVKAHK